MISLHNVSKSYRKHLVLNDISVTLKPGKVHFLMGPNGAGKTTLIKCLLGLENCQGRIEVGGEPATRVVGQCFAVFDDTPLYPHLNGYQNLRLLTPPDSLPHDGQEAPLPFVDHALMRQCVKHYSYGQRKKLSLLIARLNNTPCLFLDEVSNGLDYDSLLELRDWLKQWAQDHTLLLTGHQFEFYDTFVDSVMVLSQGKLTQIDDFHPTKDKLSEIYQQHMGEAQA